jgi:hypothetical protein
VRGFLAVSFLSEKVVLGRTFVPPAQKKRRGQTDRDFRVRVGPTTEKLMAVKAVALTYTWNVIFLIGRVS